MGLGSGTHMADVLQTLLTPSRVTKIVSRIRTPGGVVARHFGWNIGGPNVEQVQGRTYTYDIYDNVRAVARGRLPGAPASTIAKNPVGNNRVTLARSAEKIPMDYETVSSIRVIGEHAGTHDRLGMRYIERQGYTLNQRQENFREFFAGSVMRGGLLYFYQSGLDLLPTYDSTGTLFGIDLQLNSNYKLTGGSFAAGLAMDTGSNIITASWATASTDIPLALMTISAGFQQGVGAPLACVFLDSGTWLYILQNDKVRQLAGTSNTSFASFEMTPDKAADGTPTGLMKGRIKGIDWIEFYIYDGGLDTFPSGTATYTRLFPESYCTFMIAPDRSWIQGVEGSEPVKINDMAPAKEEMGYFSWIMEKADPARFELHSLQNFGMELNVPKGVAWARVR